MDLAVSIELLLLAVVAIIAAAAYFWPRRAVHGASEDTAPLIEQHAVSRPGEHRDWIAVDVLATNREACRWVVETARATIPAGAKICIEQDLPKSPDKAAWDPPTYVIDEAFLAGLGNTAAVNRHLAHAGRRTNSNINGENDSALINLWLYLPRSANEFRIEFSLRSKDTSQRVVVRTLDSITPP